MELLLRCKYCGKLSDPLDVDSLFMYDPFSHATHKWIKAGWYIADQNIACPNPTCQEEARNKCRK